MAKLPFADAVDTERVYPCTVCGKLTRWHIPAEPDMPEATMCSEACFKKFDMVESPTLSQENSSVVSGAELVSTGK